MTNFGEELRLETPAEAEARIGKEGDTAEDPAATAAAAAAAQAEAEKLKADVTAKNTEDAAAADKLAAQILNGELGNNGTESSEVPAPEVSVENEPLSTVLQPYEEKINTALAEADGLDLKAAELKQAGGKFEEWDSMVVKARKLRNAVFDGRDGYSGDGAGDLVSLIDLPPRKPGELSTVYEARVDAAYEEYSKAAHDSPQIILKIAESGAQPGYGLESISPRLLRDKKFIETLSKTKWAQNDTKFQVAKRDNLFGAYSNQGR